MEFVSIQEVQETRTDRIYVDDRVWNLVDDYGAVPYMTVRKVYSEFPIGAAGLAVGA